MKWQLVADAPKDGRTVLAKFKGQFGKWVVFVAQCTSHHGVFNSQYAAPTHFAEIEHGDE